MAFFTMGIDLQEVVKQLKQQYPADTPMAIVFNAGTLEKQSVLHATLDTIIETIQGQELPFEHMIYIGDFLKENGYK